MAAPHPLLLPLLRGDDLGDIVIDESVVVSAEEHFVTALLNAEVDRRGIGMDHDLRARLTADAMATAAESAATTATAIRVTELAAELGVCIAVFKGPAIAHRLYDQPDLRPALDLDVFVAPHHLDRFGDLAQALGASDDTLAATEAMVASGRVFELSLWMDDVQVDLHRDPLNMILVSPDEEDRWARTTELALPGSSIIRTMDLEDTIIHTTLNLFRDAFSDLLHLNDFRLMADAEPDWAEVDRRAAAGGLRDVVRYGVHTASRLLGAPSPLPTAVTRWRKLWFQRIWPDDLLLKGHHSHANTLRRQFALGPALKARPCDLASAYAERLLPPRSVLADRYGDAHGPYVADLIRWRLDQRRQNALFKQGASGDVK